MKSLFRFPPLHPNIIGSFWMIGSVFCFLTSNLFVKATGTSLPTFQLVFMRGVFQSLILLPIVMHKGFAVMKSKHIGNYALRLGFGITNIVLMFYAVANLPFATATSLVFSRPLFTIVLAAVLLNERVGWKRGLATVLGFVGILLVLNPGPVGLTRAELAGVGASFSLAVTYIYIQKLSRTENHVAMMMWFSVTATVTTAVPAYLQWETFDLKTLGCLFVIAATATLAQYCVIRAYQVGKITVISPLEYLQTPLSALAGFLFFAESTTLNFWAGTVIIIATGFYIVRKKPGD